MQGVFRGDPVSQLVARLRAIHEGQPERAAGAGAALRARPMERSVTRSATPARPSPRGRTNFPPALIDALRRIDNSQVASRGHTGTPADSYARIREIFRHREEKLRREATVVDRILDRMGADRGSLPGSPASPLQQDLRVLCQAGGRGRGRFVVVNEAATTRVVRFQPARPRGRDARVDERPVLSFVPAEITLGVGASREVEVVIDLSVGSIEAGGCLEWPIDLCSGDARIGRLWLEIVVTEARP